MPSNNNMHNSDLINVKILRDIPRSAPSGMGLLRRSA